MPVDLVKFDIGMVHLLANGDDRQQQLLQEIASMVVSAGYQMVAEGVETRELLDKVISLGFSHAQGYYFDRPQTPEQFAALNTENPAGCEPQPRLKKPVSESAQNPAHATGQ